MFPQNRRALMLGLVSFVVTVVLGLLPVRSDVNSASGSETDHDVVNADNPSGDNRNTRPQYALSEGEFRKHLERLSKQKSIKPSDRECIPPFPSIETECRELQLRLVYDYRSLSSAEQDIMKERIEFLHALTKPVPEPAPTLGSKARAVIAKMSDRVDALQIRLPTVANLAFALVSACTLLPLLFLVLFVLNGKHLRK